MAEVRARSSLDPSGFKQGTKAMSREVKGFSSQLSSMKGLVAGAFSVTALVGMSKAAIELGSNITDMAVQAGLTTDEFQALEFAAIKAGTAPEKIRTVMSKISVTLGQAKRGMKTYIDLFKELGISQEEILKLDTPGAFELIAQKMATATEGSKAYGAGLEILGTRSGAQLIEVLREIADVGLQGVIDKAKEAGQVMDEDLVQRLDALADKLALTSRLVKVGFGTALDFLGTKIQQTGTFWGSFSDQLEETRKGTNRLIAPFTTLAKVLLGGGLGRARAAIEQEKMQKANEELLAQRKKLAEQEPEAFQTLDEFYGRTKPKLDEKVIAARLKAKEKELAIEKKLDAVMEKRREKESKFEKKAGELAEIALGGKVKLGAQVSDSLARIGGFTGGAVSPQARIAERQLLIAEQMLQFIKRQPDEIAKRLMPLLEL